MGKMKNIAIDMMNEDGSLKEGHNIEDFLVSKFIAFSIKEHCDGNKEKIQSFMMSMVMSMSATGMICPKCFLEGMTDCINTAFEMNEDKDGNHDIKLKIDDLKDKPDLH